MFNPFSNATTTSCTRSGKLRLPRMPLLCVFTVASLSYSPDAISTLLSPRAASGKMSRSRASQLLEGSRCN